MSNTKSVSRLYNQFQPEHYDLQLDLDTAKNLATGKVVITGKKVGKPSQRITFHDKGLKILKASIIKHDKKGDAEVAVARINQQKSYDELRLHADEMLYPGNYTVTIEFVAPIQESMHGIYASKYQIDGTDKQLISTQFESHHAREAFPCIDEPEAKATFDLALTTPKDLVVVSNMPPSDTKDTSGKQTVQFQTSPRMSTYLLAFGVGELQHKTVKTSGGVDVSVYATLSHRPEALDFALETTKRCIEFFNDYYGTPYPLPKCDMMAIPDFSSAAMENWGLVTYREPYILADPDTISQSSKEVIATVIAHELSHQWFGNLVTMKWWDDLWLNESFANVMEYVGVNALFPEWHAFNTFVANEGLAAFRRDSIAGVQPIKVEVNHPDEISTLFDPSIVYAKGGRILNMLRTFVGEDDFRAGLKQYFAKHQYGNTTGDDLWAAISEASGKDVAAFMNPWLHQPGFPVVSVDQKDEVVQFEQHHFLTDPSKADQSRLWPVPLLSNNDKLPDLLETREFSTSIDSKGFVQLDAGAVGHYIVHYKQPDHAAWISGQVESQTFSEVERLMVLSDSTLLARNGVVSMADSLRLLSHYRQETSETVWGVMALVLADARRFIDAEPEIEDAIKAMIRKLIESEYKRLGWQEQSGESNHDIKQRASILALGCYAEYPEIKTEALRLFAEAKSKDALSDGKLIPAELRGVILGTAVRFDDANSFEYLLKLEETTTDPELKQELLGALSNTREASRGQQLLDRLKDVKKVRRHDVDHWLVLMMRNRHTQELAWSWLRDNWQWIETTFAGDKSYDYFPRYAASALNTRQRLAEYKAFFGPMSEVPVLARNIAMGIEELENRVAWVERDLAAVNEFFEK